jgi:hypothetical protein
MKYSNISRRATFEIPDDMIHDMQQEILKITQERFDHLMTASIPHREIKFDFSLPPVDVLRMHKRYMQSLHMIATAFAVPLSILYPDLYEDEPLISRVNNLEYRLNYEKEFWRRIFRLVRRLVKRIKP